MQDESSDELRAEPKLPPRSGDGNLEQFTGARPNYPNGKVLSSETDLAERQDRLIEVIAIGERAIRLYNDGRIDEALKDFLTARALGPLNSGLKIFLMRTEYRLGDYAGALETIQQILQDNPCHAEALKTGGRIANSIENVSLAKEFWEVLAECHASDKDAPLQLARIAWRTDNMGDAVTWGRRFLRIVPSDAEVLGITISAMLRTLEMEGIGEFLARYFQLDRDRSIILLEQLSRAGMPTEYAEALAATQRHLNGDQHIAALIAEASAAFLTLGLQAEAENRDPEAACFYCAIRLIDADSEGAEKGLERLRRYVLTEMREAFRQEEFGRVSLLGRRAIATDPRCFEAWMTVGRAHFLSGDYSSARDCFRECVEMRDRDSWAWLNYARALDRVEDWGMAFDAYRHVAQLAETENGEHVAECNRAGTSLFAKALYAGRQAAEDNHVDVAWQYYEVAAKIEPVAGGVKALKTRLLRAMHARIRELWLQESSDVIEICQDYVKRDPHNIYVLQVLGRSLMKKYSFGEALEIWERLALTQPANASHRLQVARCCDWLKMREVGIAAAREAHQLDPTLSEAQTIVKRLESLPATGRATRTEV